ncbi:hypothetical protein GCM10009665_33580 [Kitasatospora nipponensis]|uniref:Uncharacterized protein n=1 Tax=Kitasatospora nipponensis TaxID=258049 RepID=A0ABN1W877_9ACTN
MPCEREPICSFGRWLFVPDRLNAAGDVRTGYLACNGERVVLAHCSHLLADLLRTIRQLERDFATGCGVDPMPARA